MKACSYTGDVFLVCVVEVVDFLLEGVQDLAVSRHVCGQDQSDGSLKDAARSNESAAHTHRKKVYCEQRGHCRT